MAGFGFLGVELVPTGGAGVSFWAVRSAPAPSAEAGALGASYGITSGFRPSNAAWNLLTTRFWLLDNRNLVTSILMGMFGQQVVEFDD